MKEYVLGFAFSRNKEEVVLIKKNKPEWQKGRYNGIGGKIEIEDHSPLHAMIREFKEETGVGTLATIGETNGWSHFGTMIFNEDIMGGGARVFLFRMFSNAIYQCETMEEEAIERFLVSDILKKEEVIMHNLPVLIRLALSNEFAFTEFNQKLIL